MQKTLRSLIHEKIPPELRFQLELLSRKRNLINEEKHEKIIELLREFKVKDVVQLGPGTNRYAIKIDGYVVKIATDNDGKIDNLKEFKMAKRLYPYVTKTYEVSENGTLLVAEYISPFSSYNEMTQYAEQIRDILTKLSSTYLIGDVGITSKNYANWGLRAGSNEPVCLDFAYVYEVSSELFICRKCNFNAMLIPDKDFKELYCSNTACGAKYSFEDIRSKIGNDIHRHEIGDLKTEGYYLTSSNVNTELDDQRSNYLAKKKVNKNNEKQNLKSEEDNDMSKNLENNMAIADMLLSNGDCNFIKATARLANGANTSNLIKAEARLANPKPQMDEEDEEEYDEFDDSFEETDEEELAFVGSIDIDDIKEDNKPDIIQIPEEKVIIKAEARSAEEAKVIEEKVESSQEDDEECEINDRFVRNMKKAFSNISNRISNCLHIEDHFNTILPYLKSKMYPEDYYKEVQNAVYNSLVRFCNFSIETKVNDSGNSYKVFIPPTELIGTIYEPTLIFMSRVWNNKRINTVADPDMMSVYAEFHDDYLGIQREWLDAFRSRLSEKLKLNNQGIDKIVESIAAIWCVPETENSNEEVVEEFEEDVIVEEPEEEFDEVEVVDSSTDDEYLAFEGSVDIDVVQNPNEEISYISIDDEDDEEREFLSVYLYNEDDCDIIHLNTEEFFGLVSIPFYANLDKINENIDRPSVADNRNEMWDWLIHMVPDMMFKTKNPDVWLAYNGYEYENQIHMVIMDYDHGVYTMGIYYLSGIFLIDDDGNKVLIKDESMLKKICKVIRDDICYTSISHLKRSLNRTDLMHSEEEIINMVKEYTSDIVDDDTDEVEEAAIEAIMGTEPVNSVDETESVEEEIIEEVVKDVKKDEVVETPQSEQPTQTKFKPIRYKEN